MNKNFILKLLCSLPIILLFLYFIPFIGIILLITRFIFNKNKILRTNIFLVILGLILLLPLLINSLILLLNLSFTNLYINSLVNTDFYINIVIFSKFIISSGIIFIILSILFNHLFAKLINTVKQLFIAKSAEESMINKQNDLEIKLKQERAKNTHVVICPYCGADNMLTEKTRYM